MISKPETMSRQSRVVAVGVPHHITQRGNNRHTVFRSDADRVFYLDTLRRLAREHGIDILGYCLMSNHVHVIAVPQHEHSLARAIGQTQFIYAQRFNRNNRRSGHLWQGRFYSAPLGPGHLFDALLYVDLNPVRARLVETAEQYSWSSAKAHIEHRDPSQVVDVWAWSDLDPAHDWRDRLRLADYSRRGGHQLRRALRSGHPCGSEKFIAELETTLNRRLRPAKPGPRVVVQASNPTTATIAYATP